MKEISDSSKETTASQIKGEKQFSDLTASDTMKDISQSSTRARVSAASVDRAIHFNLVELQVIGDMLLNLSL